MATKNIIIAQREATVANLRLEQVDLKNVGNRRFMYNPKTGTLLLGDEDRIRNRRGHDGSHAEEFHDAGIQENFDDFVRGWLGYNSRQYRHGIIHFAPNICEATFDQGFDTLTAFADQLRIDGKTKILNFVKYGEQLMGDLLPKRFQ